MKMQATFIFSLLLMATTSYCSITPFAIKSGGIDIIVVIDSVKLIDSKNNGSQKPNSPTPIDHSYAFMIASDQFVKSGQASADLHIKALTGDIINWYGTSDSNNLDYSIIVYNIRYNSDKLGKLDKNVIDRKQVYPIDGNIENVNTVLQKIFKLSASVNSAGNVNYNVDFALYEIDRNTGNQILKGYFTWDPEITIV